MFFSWASLAHLLSLGFLNLFTNFAFPWTFTNFIDFPDPITLFSSLGFMGLPLTPYFLCLHYFRPTVAHSHFSMSYTAHRYAISLFPGFFKPIYLLKAHLFISWACDPLFLPLWPNGFTTCLPTLCCPYGWPFFFLLGFSKMTLNNPQRLRLSVKSIVMDFILFQQERVEITVPIISKSKRETPTPPPPIHSRSFQPTPSKFRFSTKNYKN